MESIILIGIQASGKSTFYKEKFFNTHIRISNDLLKTKNREKLLLQYCKEAQISFVIDNTNITKDVRRGYIQFSKSLDIPVIGYYFRTDVQRSLEWNNTRTGKERISKAGILGTYKKLEIPSLEEGFNQLYYVDVKGNHFEIQEWRDEV